MDNDRLRLITRAIRNQCELDVLYQSFTKEIRAHRTIVPHALAFDGFRWHVRAWCKTSDQFKDFVITRMVEIGEMREGAVNPACDLEWTREFSLQIAPHPKLSAAQKKVVEQDYGMTKGVREVRTTIALAYYLIRQLNLDLDDTAASPERLQVTLNNRDDYERARDDALAASKAMISIGRLA